MFEIDKELKDLIFIFYGFVKYMILRGFFFMKRGFLICEINVIIYFLFILRGCCEKKKKKRYFFN